VDGLDIILPGAYIDADNTYYTLVNACITCNINDWQLAAFVHNMMLFVTPLAPPRNKCITSCVIAAYRLRELSCLA
jgi:hypothetical protein